MSTFLESMDKPPQTTRDIYKLCYTMVRCKMDYAQKQHRILWRELYKVCLELEQAFPDTYVNAWESAVNARIPDPLSQPFYARLEAQR